MLKLIKIFIQMFTASVHYYNDTERQMAHLKSITGFNTDIEVLLRAIKDEAGKSQLDRREYIKREMHFEIRVAHYGGAELLSEIEDVIRDSEKDSIEKEVLMMRPLPDLHAPAVLGELKHNRLNRKRNII